MRDASLLWESSALTDKFGAIVCWLMWLPDHLNHQAVLFFFVLSGFCIHLGVAKTLARGEYPRSETARFYAKRLIRIAPPLIAALFMTYFLDAWSYKFIEGVNVPMPSSPQMHSAASGAYQDPSVFAGNLFFLMPFFVSPYGTNWPLWALGYEAWYYLLYPIWFWLSRSVGGPIAFAMSLGVSFLSVIFVHGSGFQLYPVMSTWWLWCLGALLAEVYVGRYEMRWLNLIPPWPLGLIAYLAVVVLTMFPPQHGLVFYAIWGPILGVIVYRSAVSMKDPLGRIGDALSELGRFSYSMYLIHMPVIVLMAALWLHHIGPLPKTPWFVSPAIAFTVALSGVMAVLVERPLERIRSSQRILKARSFGPIESTNSQKGVSA